MCLTCYWRVSGVHSWFMGPLYALVSVSVLLTTCLPSVNCTPFCLLPITVSDTIKYMNFAWSFWWYLWSQSNACLVLIIFLWFNWFANKEQFYVNIKCCEENGSIREIRIGVKIVVSLCHVSYLIPFTHDIFCKLLQWRCMETKMSLCFQMLYQIIIAKLGFT